MTGFDEKHVPAHGRLIPINKPVFSDRASLVGHVRILSPGLTSTDVSVSHMHGGRAAAKKCLANLDPVKYGASRNHLDGAITRLSPYIRHGVLNDVDVRDKALSLATPKQAEKFIQQLTWRAYWQHLYSQFPEHIWEDVEPYKTGFQANTYAPSLPTDIANGQTGVACIDQFISELLETGYLHNHARLYVASYVCHWRRVKWQAGAEWFLSHLLDGDLASNNFSWQWVASTFSHKPYYFNLENVSKFSGINIDTSVENNAELAGTYEDLHERLFPNLEAKS